MSYHFCCFRTLNQDPCPIDFSRPGQEVPSLVRKMYNTARYQQINRSNQSVSEWLRQSFFWWHSVSQYYLSIKATTVMSSIIPARLEYQCVRWRANAAEWYFFRDFILHPGGCILWVFRKKTPKKQKTLCENRTAMYWWNSSGFYLSYLETSRYQQINRSNQSVSEWLRQSFFWWHSVSQYYLSIKATTVMSSIIPARLEYQCVRWRANAAEWYFFRDFILHPGGCILWVFRKKTPKNKKHFVRTGLQCIDGIHLDFIGHTLTLSFLSACPVTSWSSALTKWTPWLYKPFVSW